MQRHRIHARSKDRPLLAGLLGHLNAVADDRHSAVHVGDIQNDHVQRTVLSGWSDWYVFVSLVKPVSRFLHSINISVYFSSKQPPAGYWPPSAFCNYRFGRAWPTSNSRAKRGKTEFVALSVRRPIGVPSIRSTSRTIGSCGPPSRRKTIGRVRAIGWCVSNGISLARCYITLIYYHTIITTRLPVVVDDRLKPRCFYIAALMAHISIIIIGVITIILCVHNC